MDKIYTIIYKKTGKELYATFDISKLGKNELAVEELRTESMPDDANPHFDFETRTFYDKIN